MTKLSRRLPQTVWRSIVYRTVVLGLALPTFASLPAVIGMPAATSPAHPGAAGGPVEGQGADMVLVGSVAESVALRELIHELVRSEGITPRFSSVPRLSRAALVGAATAPSTGRVRVWVRLLKPQRALLLFAGPAGKRYLVREVPLRSGLDELGRERIAQVVQSSALALLRGSAGIDRRQMQDALPEDQEPPRERASAARADPAARPKTEPPWGLACLAVTYAALGSGSKLGIRHGPGFRAGFDRLGGTGWSVALAGQYHFAQSYESKQIGVRTRTQALRLLVGHTWPLGNHLRLAPTFGGGIDTTQVTPTSVPGSNATLREGGTYVAFKSRAELGLELTLAGFVLGLTPCIEASWSDTHYDLVQDGIPQSVVVPWRILPGIQLSAGFRPGETSTPQES